MISIFGCYIFLIRRWRWSRSGSDQKSIKMANFAQNSRDPYFRKFPVFHDPETSLQQLTATHQLKGWVPRGFLTTLQTHPNSPKLTRWVQPWSSLTRSSSDPQTTKCCSFAQNSRSTDFSKIFTTDPNFEKTNLFRSGGSAPTVAKRWKLWNKPKNKFWFRFSD